MATVRYPKIWWTILLTITICSISLPAYAQYGGGSGTVNKPYLIYTAEQMNAIGANQGDWDKHFKLMADIDLSSYTGTDFNIIGTWDNSFTGVFDGNGHTISNFTYTSTDRDDIGLFGYVGWEAVIKDLGLIDPNVDAGTGWSVGSLSGSLGQGTISNCYVEGGSVSGEEWIGGLVGFNLGTITGCYSTANVSGNWLVGGLVGENAEPSTVTNCYSTGSVSGDRVVGGLVGQNLDTIINCYSTGRVSGDQDVGGLVGDNSSFFGSDGTTSNSFWDIETSGQTTSSGGIGKTTAQMQTASTFVGWSFGSVWTIDEGKDYPRLCWENKTGEEPDTQQLSDFLTGAGTEDDPYLIYTADQLNTIGLFPRDWDKHFKLMADIDLSKYTGIDFNIIGYFAGSYSLDNRPFTGVFDGNGKKILNFNCNSTGLFGYIHDPNAVIKDLGLIDPNINAGAKSAGSLVGYLEGGTITGCYVESGSVTGLGLVGGLVGENCGIVTNCYSTANVSGDLDIGGLVGCNLDGTIINCCSSGSITGTANIGGLAGYNWDGAIINCYSSGSVSGNWEVGGLVGENWSIITKCYSTCSVVGSNHVGGLVGLDMLGDIANSFWDIETSGQLTSAGGSGKTTAQMQTESTFTQAGWDFVGESANGTEDIWWILEGQSYPRLWWQYGQAFAPHPPDEAIGVIEPVILNWIPGGSNLYHDVYLGDNEEAVAHATTESPDIYRGRQAAEMTTYDPGPLELDKTYYWRIDEVNEADPNGPWKGDVWSFTTAGYLVVDDFESYTDDDRRDDKPIWQVWIDGFGIPENGAMVGYCELSWSWRGPKRIHGGVQSMDIYYDNSGPAYYSEATANTANLVIGQDWTMGGVEILSLWFYGDPNNAPEPMYVALSNAKGPTAVVYHDNPDAVLIDEWTEWRIDLQAFAAHGVNLTEVDSISIGFGDKNNPQPGSTGLVFFDDIRLYRPQSVTNYIQWMLEG